MEKSGRLLRLDASSVEDVHDQITEHLETLTELQQRAYEARKNGEIMNDEVANQYKCCMVLTSSAMSAGEQVREWE